MKVAGFRSKIVAIVIGSTLVAALFFVGNGPTAIQGVAQVDDEPLYDITVTNQLCNALPGHALPAVAAGSNPNCVDDTTPGGPRTSTTIFTIPEGRLNFSSFNTYESTEVEFTPGCNVDQLVVDGVEDTRVYPTASGKSPSHADGIDNDNDGATDEDGECLAPGDLVGGMRSDSDLALFNGTCTYDVTVDFAFYNVALPNNADDPRASTNIATPANEGVADRIRSLMKDTLPGPGDGLADWDSPGILAYPDWFLDLFDPDYRGLLPSEGGPREGAGQDPEGTAQGYSVDFNGPLKPVIPIALYGAITDVAGTATPLYFVQFGDGDLAPYNADPNHFYNVAAQPGMGQLNMSVLTDTTPTRMSSSTIADFCSELIARTMFFGTTGNGMTRAINPSTTPDTGYTKYWTTSQRDQEADGYEGQVDTCPALANLDDLRFLGGVGGDDDTDGVANEDPINGIDDDGDCVGTPPVRPPGPCSISGGVDEDGNGDPDLDRIDSSCDPNPGINDGINVDGDVDASGFGFQNAQDICPQIANPLQEESELQSLPFPPDGGPRVDSIGNECDVGAIPAYSQDGYSGPALNATLSPTVANGNYHLTTVVNAVCYGGTDSDGDGYCAEDDDTGQDGNATRHKAWSGTLSSAAADRDGDGYSDYLESYLGTNPTKACAFSATAGDENSSQASGGIGTQSPFAHDAWPTDFNDDGKSAMQDVIYGFVTSLAGVGGLNNDANPPLNRVDLNADGFVAMQDVILGFVTKLAPTGLNKLCTLETQQ